MQPPINADARRHSADNRLLTTDYRRLPFICGSCHCERNAAICRFIRTWGCPPHSGLSRATHCSPLALENVLDTFGFLTFKIPRCPHDGSPGTTFSVGHSFGCFGHCHTSPLPRRTRRYLVRPSTLQTGAFLKDGRSSMFRR